MGWEWLQGGRVQVEGQTGVELSTARSGGGGCAPVARAAAVARRRAHPLGHLRVADDHKVLGPEAELEHGAVDLRRRAGGRAGARARSRRQPAARPLPRRCAVPRVTRRQRAWPRGGRLPCARRSAGPPVGRQPPPRTWYSLNSGTNTGWPTISRMSPVAVGMRAAAWRCHVLPILASCRLSARPAGAAGHAQGGGGAGHAGRQRCSRGPLLQSPGLQQRTSGSPHAAHKTPAESTQRAAAPAHAPGPNGSFASRRRSGRVSRSLVLPASVNSPLAMRSSSDDAFLPLLPAGPCSPPPAAQTSCGRARAGAAATAAAGRACREVRRRAGGRWCASAVCDSKRVRACAGARGAAARPSPLPRPPARFTCSAAAALRRAPSGVPTKLVAAMWPRGVAGGRGPAAGAQD